MLIFKNKSQPHDIKITIYFKLIKAGNSISVFAAAFRYMTKNMQLTSEK